MAHYSASDGASFCDDEELRDINQHRQDARLKILVSAYWGGSLTYKWNEYPVADTDVFYDWELIDPGNEVEQKKSRQRSLIEQ